MFSNASDISFTDFASGGVNRVLQLATWVLWYPNCPCSIMLVCLNEGVGLRVSLVDDLIRVGALDLIE